MFRQRGGGAVAAQVARQSASGLQGPADRFLDALRRVALADVFQQQGRRADQGDRVGQPLAGDVRGTAVDRLENGTARADVGPGHQPQAAHQAGTEVADHVAEQVLHDQHVEACRVEGQLQAQRIDVQLLELQEGIIVGDLPRGGQEQAVAQRQHVGLVAQRDAVPASCRASSKA